MITNITFDKAEADAFLNALPQTIFRARRSAVTKTTNYVKKEVQNRMAAQSGIRATVFKRFRVKSKRQGESGLVWLGLNEVKASYVGTLKQDAGGAFAGQYYFAGGFIATTKSGHTGIFKRKGKSRLPLAEQKVTLSAGVQVAESVAADAGRVLTERFAAKVRELNPHID